jgi:toxin ParE1/3/4
VTARYRVVWTEVAARDYETILTFVAYRSGIARATKLDEKLRHALASLEVVPTRCRVVPELRIEGLDVYRELMVRPYRIMFRIRGKDVVLLAVVDGRRDLQELLLERALMD